MIVDGNLEAIWARHGDFGLEKLCHCMGDSEEEALILLDNGLSL